nr:hypothetical protein SHINE37_100231 [Rhizobiaceae bacterium]
MEARHARGPGTQREPAGLETLWPGALAELERVSPPQQGGDENEPHEAARPAADVAGLRPPFAEVQIRAAAMNRFTALGIQVTVAMG